MQQAHGFFRIKETIGNQSQKERGNDRGQWGAAVSGSDDIGEVVGSQAKTQSGEPCSPDEKLEKHHDGKFKANGRIHRSIARESRRSSKTWQEWRRPGPFPVSYITFSDYLPAMRIAFKEWAVVI